MRLWHMQMCFDWWRRHGLTAERVKSRIRSKDRLYDCHIFLCCITKIQYWNKYCTRNVCIAGLTIVSITECLAALIRGLRLSTTPVFFTFYRNVQNRLVYVFESWVHAEIAIYETKKRWCLLRPVFFLFKRRKGKGQKWEIIWRINDVKRRAGNKIDLIRDRQEKKLCGTHFSV